MRITQPQVLSQQTSNTQMRQYGSQWKSARRSLRRYWQLYLVMIPTLLYFIVFRYIPMANAVLAFKDYSMVLGIWGSPWVGFKYFELFFNNPVFWNLMKNTLGLSLYSLIIGFPIPILLAIFLNEIKNGAFKRTVQLVTYAPYFISTVIMVSMLMLFFSPRLGIVNVTLAKMEWEQVNFLGVAKLFPSLYVWSGVWQFSGYSAIIYLAALAGVDPQLYEAAIVDGASRIQRIINIDLPGIMPVAVILLILNVGSLLGVGFEKVYLMQNQLNMQTSEVIATYVYKIGLLNSNFSFATAVGLFNSVVNMALLVGVNFFAKRVSETSLW